MLSIISNSIIVNTKKENIPRTIMLIKDNMKIKRKAYYNMVKLYEDYKNIFSAEQYVIEIIYSNNCYRKYIAINSDSVEKILRQENEQYRLLIENTLKFQNNTLSF